MENKDTINEVLNQLLVKTKEKKISWTSINPNAFRWVKNEEGIITNVTLQKQPSPNPIIKESYILSIQSNQPGIPPTQINSTSDHSLIDVLSKLFSAASEEVSKNAKEKQAEIIKNLLRGL